MNLFPASILRFFMIHVECKRLRCMREENDYTVLIKAWFWSEAQYIYLIVSLGVEGALDLLLSDIELAGNVSSIYINEENCPLCGTPRW